MDESKIIELIGLAINDGKYLSVTYKNQKGGITPFWICILDIMNNDELSVHIFNVTKDNPILNSKISISGIQTLELLNFTSYKVPEFLKLKIESDENFKKFRINRFDKNVLNYYLECYEANRDPFLYRTHLIPKVDLSTFLKENPYKLNDDQLKTILKEIYHNDYNKNVHYELAISEFSIDIESKGKFVVAYKKLTFDPVKKNLHLSDNTYFNANFYINNIRFSLPHYTDLLAEEFEELFVNDKNSAIDLLKSNFNQGESPNTRPEIIVLGFSQINISKIYEEINIEFESKKAEIPLKVLFGDLSSTNRKNRKEPNIVIYDNLVDVDQLRTIYNSLKFPVTYVQGPPGTGKTQTILNIVVNCFTNNKTLLISSNNNIPIDSIKDKLVLGKYKNKEIVFPIIRLGNNNFVLSALKKIKELYLYENNDVPKDNLLAKIKENSREKNKQLVERLKEFENRIDLKQNIEFIDGLLKKGNNFLLEKEKHVFEEKLAKIPENSNEDLTGIFEQIKGNNQLLQFFYFESLKCIKRLKNKEFRSLIDILHLENDEEKIKSFNKWISDDENLDRFTKVFPIILSTNLSSRKLGKSYKFDLLVVDEAGQCDIATSLIPISKCKNMVLIGDSNQLKPIVVFEEVRNKELMNKHGVKEVYDYYKNSILSVYKNIDNISRSILLSQHYRCGRKIINYSNMRFYENKLKLSSTVQDGAVMLLDVNNVNQSKKNAQIEEALEILNYIKNNDLSDVFIITPFRNQEVILNSLIKQAKEKGEINDSVECGTIHKIQGRENKTIIISTAISKSTNPKTYNWIKNNSQLINVGVTRAKENLIVVTDKKAIDILSNKKDDLYALIEYVQKNGTTEVKGSNANKFTIGFSNDSKFEDEFYKTMQHFCSTTATIYRRNIKIVDLFPELKGDYSISAKEFDGVIFENNQPKVVFEINGTEHSTCKKAMESDKIKMRFLQSKNIQLFLIPNQYVQHYEFIRSLINKVNGQGYQRSLFEVS
ncbi:MAG: DNA helicase [Crocinitomicaceae bacterium]|nr:DNA helicase [Crocinitomicaceae bacterium]MBP6032075.1 DNA helicase [Crocinitomicaceae bacterium]